MGEYPDEDEEQIAARALGDLLTSAMLHAYEHDNPKWAGPRRWLYGWERDGLSWLIRFKERRPDGHHSSLWISSFIDLNREAILDPDGKMDFNLRAARLNRPDEPSNKQERDQERPSTEADQ